MSAPPLPPILSDPALYAAGGLYEVVADEPDAGWRETVASLFGGYAYDRPIRQDLLFGDPGFVTRLAAHYAWINATFPRGAASALVRLRGVTIRDRGIDVETSSGVRSLYETRRFVDLPYLPNVAPSQPVVELPDGEDHLHLGSAGSFNYGHFLADDLTRLKALALAPRSPGRPLSLVMTSHGEVIDRVREEALRALDAGAFRVRFLDAATTYRAEALLYPTPVSLHPALKSPEALDELAGRGRRLAARTPVARHRVGPGRGRLFLFRRPERGRALVNWDEIRAVLVRHRFRVIDPESLSFAEQVAHLAEAELVVGQMGATMANTLFCQPGTRVLHLAPEGWEESFYWDLAAVRGHLYGACYGRPAGEGAPHAAGFALDPALLAAALETMA